MSALTRYRNLPDNLGAKDLKGIDEPVRARDDLMDGGVHDLLFGRFVDAHFFDDFALARDEDAVG